MIFPVMEGWKLQWYSKVPFWLKVCWKVAFVARVPLLNRLSLLVTVWEAESLLVQVTVAPTDTVNVGGTKAKPDISALA
jgi:hypothetical protein